MGAPGRGDGPRPCDATRRRCSGERVAYLRTPQAVLGARAAGSGEQVLQGGHAQLGLDQRAHRVKDEVLAVVEDGFAIATEDALDGDDPRVLVDGELAAHTWGRRDDARLDDPHVCAGVVEVAPQV